MTHDTNGADNPLPHPRRHPRQRSSIRVRLVSRSGSPCRLGPTDWLPRSRGTAATPTTWRTSTSTNRSPRPVPAASSYGVPASSHRSDAVPARPVPQLPPNLTSQNKFLSSPPGINIPSRPTGFPGAGGGSNFLTAPPPLVPQVTGYMDTRLEMIGSRFLPTPSAAFPTGRGAGGPHFEDAFLQ